MNLRVQLLKFASWFHNHERDPRRAQATWREFDQRRHYADYHRRCRAAWRRSPAPAVDIDLEQRGFSCLQALRPAAAAACAAELEERHAPQLLSKVRPLEGYRIADRRWLKGLLDQVLQDSVDAAIAAFFRSEYLVHSLAFTLIRPAPAQKSVSFRWHCDKGPSAHLKLIIYLNPTAAHGGNTEFMELADSMAVAEQGYLFGWSKARTADVGHLARLAGRPLATHLHARDAGEAVLFQPSRVLHRGISPTLAPRLTATLCLLPSPVSWQRAFEHETLSDIAADEKWHDDALDFLSVLEQRLRRDAAGVNA